MAVHSLRPASRNDHGEIKSLIRSVRINPVGLDWRRFVVAIDDQDQLIGCGQVKPHRDGSHELSSVAVVGEWRGKGVARAIIERLMAGHEPPLWLTCRSSLMSLYESFGFREVKAGEEQPAYFRRLRRLVDAFQMFSTSDDFLAVMVWEG